MRIKGKWIWIAQRFTAGILLLDALAMVFWWALHPSFTHEELHAYITTPWVGVLKMLVVLMLVIHAALGLWAIGTDYIRPMQFGRAAVFLRTIYNTGFLAWLGLALYYSFLILFSR